MSNSDRGILGNHLKYNQAAFAHAHKRGRLTILQPGHGFVFCETTAIDRSWLARSASRRRRSSSVSDLFFSRSPLMRRTSPWSGQGLQRRKGGWLAP